MKVCSLCRLKKSLTCFYKARYGKLKLGSRCKDCNREEGRRWRKGNLERDRRNHRSYAKANREKIASYSRNYRLLKAHGITELQYRGLVKAQDGLCAICRAVTAELDVDHCHKSGKVRGLLCNSCNVGIGHLRDSIEILQSAIAYLSK